MSKSKKVIGSFVGLLALLLAASPFIGMFYTKKVFEKSIAMIAEHENLKIEVVAYESGLRHSQAKTVITLDDHTQSSYRALLEQKEIGPAAEPSKVTFVHTITQGPFGQGWTDHGLSLAHIETKVEEGEGTVSIPVEISSWVGFNTHITSKIKMDNWNYQSLVNGSGIKAMDINIEVDLNPISNAVDYRIDIPTITFNDQIYDIELKGLKLNSNQKLSQGIEYDNNHYQFDDFIVRLKGEKEGDVVAGSQQSLSLSGVKLAFVSKPNGKLTDWDLNGQFEKLLSDKALFGPGEYKIHLAGLDSKVLLAMRDNLKGQNLDPAAKQQQSVKLFKQLFLTKPSVQVEKFNYQTEVGAVDVVGKAQFKPETVIDENHPQGAVAGLDAELQAQMPAKIVENRVKAYLVNLALVQSFSTATQEPKPEEIDAKRKEIVSKIDDKLAKGMALLQSKKILIAENDSYRFKVNFAEGKLFINDEPKTVQDLQEVLNSLSL